MSKKHNSYLKNENISAENVLKTENFENESAENVSKTSDFENEITKITVITEENVEKNGENGEKAERFMYLGPDIPGTLLMGCPTLIVTRARFQEIYKNELEKYPEIVVFLTPVERIGTVKAEIGTEGTARNIMYKRIKKRISEEK